VLPTGICKNGAGGSVVEAIAIRRLRTFIFHHSDLPSPPFLMQIQSAMNQVKDTLRATVRLGYDGRVHKTFRGPKAEERFATEIKILRFLEKQQCSFVPRLLEAIPEKLTMITSNCGTRIEQLSEEKRVALFTELETFGVRHDDPEMRNVTYRQTDGRFCVIDFEFATILPGFDHGA